MTHIYFVNLGLSIGITILASCLYLILRKIGQHLKSKPLRFFLSIFKDIAFLISIFGIGLTIYLCYIFVKINFA